MALRATKPDENQVPTGVAFLSAKDGGDRNRSGEVEAVKECDPDRAF
jgi:hypothetical protein